MRKPKIATSIAALALLASLSLPSGTATAATISVGDNFFSPASRVVAAGTLVRFRWVGVERHNVRKNRGPGGSFRSATTNKRGVNFTRRFRQKGVYRMVCTLHPLAMRLRLTVR